MEKKSKVTNLYSLEDTDSAKVSPQQLLNVIEQELQEEDVESMVCITVTKDGPKVYISKLDSDSLVALLERIKIWYSLQGIIDLDED